MSRYYSPYSYKHSYWQISLLTIFIFVFFSITLCYAQNQFGIVPSYNAEINLGQYLTVDAKIQNRFLLYRNPVDDGIKRSGFDHTGIQAVATARKGALKDFGIGYLFRWDNREGGFVHRTIEEYTIERKLGSLSLEHRIRADQTYQSKEGVRHRIRYRLGMEKPLKGVDLDPKEYYLAFNNEYVGSYQDGLAHVEIRFLSAIGYNFSMDEQIEVGLDYRATNLMEHTSKNILWLNIGWHHNF